MIRITVELVPFGYETMKRTIGTATIVNDGTGKPRQTRGNYNVKLMTAAGRLWKECRVEGFPRTRLGAWDILYRALTNLLADRNPPCQRKTD